VSRAGAFRTPALSLAAGAAAALAHPPFGLLPGLLGYGLLLALVERSDEARPLRSAFWRGWLAGTAYFLIGCWWVAEAFLVDAAEQGWMAPFATVFLAGGLGLFWGAGSLVYRWLRPEHPAWKVLVYAGLLSGLEWLRGHVLTGFPWNLPGETWRAGSAPSQAASVIGAYGLTWLTLAAVGALVAPLIFGLDRRNRLLAGLGAATIAGLYAFGLARLAHPLAPAPDAPWVRVVQANVPQAAKYDGDAVQSIVNRYLRLTAQPAARRPDIVIWPEGALPNSANDLLSPQAWTRAAIANVIAPGQALLLGAWRIEDGAGPPLYYNSLFVLGRQADDLKVEAIYDKHRLVPFGEYLPLERLMGALGVKKLVHVGDGFSAGPPPQPLEASGVPAMQPLICYEALFPGFTREGALRAGFRARWIVNVSDDAWFGRTSGPWQHLNLASYRAIEEGLPLVRATPTGVSAVIDAYGRSRADLRLGLGAEGVIDGPLPPALKPTPFDRYGDTPFALMLSLSLLAVLPRFSPFAQGRLRT
jgi:apolipoprotein N-acyltransferase